MLRKVIKLQTPTVLWPGEGTISLSCSMYMGFSYVSQTEIDTLEPLVPEPSAFGAEMVSWNMNIFKFTQKYHSDIKALKVLRLQFCFDYML